MPVDFLHMPSKCPPFVDKWLNTRDRRDSPIDLRVVGIDDGDEVGELVVCRKHCSLPYLTFFHLAIAQKCERAPIVIGKARCENKTDRAGQTLTERTAGQIDQWRPLGADRFQQGTIQAV